MSDSAWGSLLPFNDRYCDIDLEEWEIWLGRNNECHEKARFDHIDISRKHCLISIELDEATGQYLPYIMDNSSNGTWVNGVQLEYGVKLQLNDKDRITLAVPSTKAPEWDADSIGYTFIDRSGRTTKKKKKSSTGSQLTVPSGSGELDTARHGPEPAKKKKKKKKAAPTTTEQVLQDEPSAPQPTETEPPSLSVTIPKSRPAKMKASGPEPETEIETETPTKAKIVPSRPASIVLESQLSETKPKRASGVLTPVNEAPLSPPQQKTGPTKIQGPSESRSPSTKVVSEEELEAKARPKIGKGFPKFEATREEFASDSDDDDEDKEEEPRPKKQQQAVSAAVSKNQSPNMSVNGERVTSSSKSAESGTVEEGDEEEEEEPEEQEVHVIDENDEWLNSTTAVPKASSKPSNVASVSESKGKRSIKEKAMASLEERRKIGGTREDTPITEDYIRKVTLIQCLYLRKLAKRQVKVEGRRRNIAREMLTTERVYVKHLKAGLHEYALPLKENLNNPKKKSIVTVDQYDKIFSDFEKIYEYNSKLLADLEPRVEKWNPEQCIGDIFCAITASQTKAFRDIYASYIVCYDSAQRMFDRLAAASPAFVNFVKEREATGKAQSILSCLIMPVQRLPRYKLLLSDLLRYTHPKHPDYKNLEMATNSIHEMTEYIDGAKDKADKLYRLFGTITPENMSGAKKQPDKSKKKARPMSAILKPLKIGDK